MTALLRVMPLFDVEENDYGDDVIQMLLSDMPMTVVDGSIHLLERRLHLQIKSFCGPTTRFGLLSSTTVSAPVGHD
jgi:hypothetical protein